MTRIVFFEKPGCAGNTRQRAWLEQAGHEVERRDLLAQPWSAAALLDFLAPLPVQAWFNRAAPAIRTGTVVPERLDAAAALDLLQREPLLIRRPLMRRADGATLVGFDVTQVHAWVGLGVAALPARTEVCIAADCPAAPHPAPSGAPASEP